MTMLPIEAVGESNPDDCSCEFVHASSPTCRSASLSYGAVSEQERVFPAAPLGPEYTDGA